MAVATWRCGQSDTFSRNVDAFQIQLMRMSVLPHNPTGAADQCMPVSKLNFAIVVSGERGEINEGVFPIISLAESTCTAFHLTFEIQ